MLPGRRPRSMSETKAGPPTAQKTRFAPPNTTSRSGFRARSVNREGARATSSSTCPGSIRTVRVSRSRRRPRRAADRPRDRRAPASRSPKGSAATRRGSPRPRRLTGSRSGDMDWRDGATAPGGCRPRFDALADGSIRPRSPSGCYDPPRPLRHVVPDSQSSLRQRRFDGRLGVGHPPLYRRRTRPCDASCLRSSSSWRWGSAQWR